MHKNFETKNSLKTLKVRNRRLVLSFLRTAGAVSVNEISRAIGLSKMTVHKIIDHYLAEGMISYAGKGVSTDEGGKKPNLFVFNASCRYIFGVRIGTNFLTTTIVNLKGEDIAGRRKVALVNTPFKTVAKMIGEAFTGLIAEHSLSPENCLAAVIACNGVVDIESGAVVACYHYPGWGSVIPVREALRSVLPPHIQVSVDSWWKHLAYSEANAEVGREESFFLLGNTGDYFCGGMVDNGRALVGASGLAGELGHMIVSLGTGDGCVCGGVGCLESLVSPSKVLAKYDESRRLLDAGTRNIADDREALTITHVGRAADLGDEPARLLLDEVAGYFSIAVNNIIQICDPGRLLMFGDYAKAGGFFFETLQSRVSHICLHGVDRHLRIEPTSLSDDDGVLGAASYITDLLFAKEA